MSMDSELQVFVQESDELLAEMESGLLACEKGASDADVINTIFRAAHTIKGSAGLFGLEFVVAFVHEVETALDQVRIGTVPMTSGLAVRLLKCQDHIVELIRAVRSGSREATPELSSAGVARIAGLYEALSKPGKVGGDASDATDGPAATTDWHISLRFSKEVLRHGMDPLSILRYLATFGQLASVKLVDCLGDAEEFDPECCYTGFEIRYRTEAAGERIASAFDFVREDCTLGIVPPGSPLTQYIAVLQAAGDPAPRLELLRETGTLTADEFGRLEGLMRAPSTPTDTPTTAVPAASPASTGSTVQGASRNDGRLIRVDAEKLDTLITLVGEVVIAAAGVSLGSRRTQDMQLQEATSQLAALVEQVRDSALALRMVKIGATFSRFHRVVADTARELGKDIRLEISGEDTELDKTLVEKIGDPLMHLVRNAIDHGIGSPEQRLSVGKATHGTLRLNARHESGHVVIEVSDDGKGLDRDRILAKAIERKLVQPGASLSDREVWQLIFEPGFSTAEKVTEISGRGVGMDVVNRNITAMRGTIQVRSDEGRGTTFIVRLPLTLAIINGFQVSVGATTFVIPLEMVEECIERGQVTGHDYADVRGRALPFLRLDEVLGVERPVPPRQNIVIVRSGDMRAGIVVDRLIGECQTVIKPLSKVFSRTRAITGSSILGDGGVALILDVPALVSQAIELAADMESREPRLSIN